MYRRTLRTLAFVLSLALALVACGGGDDTAGDGGDGGDTGDGAADTISFAGTDALAFSDAPATAPAGTLTVELTSEGQVNHTVAFEGIDGGTPVVEADPGETATGTVDLPAGTYTYFCTVPGHRSAGMEGVLTVS